MDGLDTPFRFLDLPEEIRMVVYAFLFAQCLLVWDSPFVQSYTYLHGTRQPRSVRTVPQWFSILLASKAVSQEAKNMLFKQANYRMKIEEHMLYRRLPDKSIEWSDILNNLNKYMPSEFLSTVAPHIKRFIIGKSQQWSLENLYYDKNPPLALLTHLPGLKVLEVTSTAQFHITLQGNKNMSELCVLTDDGKVALAPLLENRIQNSTFSLGVSVGRRLARQCRARGCALKIYIHFFRMRAVKGRMVQPNEYAHIDLARGLLYYADSKGNMHAGDYFRCLDFGRSD
ncbi:uncharacterized protein AB675_7302 [Cyphellophora attinorum]|uniref:F-box domain-containing protein n=1 Tax=Cyphellophora attinorum TaxID=1664694 RepID=A0A0N1H3M9_9EURO|nr:uncharacterized protein AB675_7302 [Phialophora attinorum]KPI36310.1 hypothetical protein AB675_7302 [Phialophora attinorum]